MPLQILELLTAHLGRLSKYISRTVMFSAQHVVGDMYINLAVEHSASPQFLQFREQQSSEGTQNAIGKRSESGPQVSSLGTEGNSHMVRLKSLCDEGRMQEALDFMHGISKQGTLPSTATCAYLVRACSKRKVLAEAKRLHSYICIYAIELDTYLGEAVVDMFVQCKSLSDGLRVFNRLPERTAFSWTAIISAYVKAGQEQEALKHYQRMQDEGVEPSKYTFVTLLKACSSLADLELGKSIHADGQRYKCESDLFVGTALVGMYAKCGSMVDARRVFDTLSERDVVTWNAVIAGYAQQEQSECALQLYAQMQDEGVEPDSWTLVSVMKAYGNLAAVEEATPANGVVVKVKCLQRAKEMHRVVIRRGYEMNIFVGTTLVDMYAQCGNMADARHVFNRLPHSSVVLWNALLAGYAEHGESKKALQLYDQMQEEGVRPDHWTFVSVLKACGNLALLEEATFRQSEPVKMSCLQKGKVIHATIVSRGYEADAFVGNTLIDMYANCGGITEAKHVFDTLPHRNVVSWNAMISGYVQQEHGDKALQLYAEMQQEGVTPSSRTWVCVLKACSALASSEPPTLTDGQAVKLSSLYTGKEIHTKVVEAGHERDPFVANSLVDMYANCGSMMDALQVLSSVPSSSVVAWTSMITGYTDQCQGEMALQLYAQMEKRGIRPDNLTFVSVLKACACLASVEKSTIRNGKRIKPHSLDTGRQIHDAIVRKGCESDPHVATALIDMYVKCGSMDDACRVFATLSHRNVVSWTTMITGYVEQEQGERALELYERMKQTGVPPDSRTIVSILKACGSLAARVEATLVDGRQVKLHCLEKVKATHAEAVRQGCEADLFVSNTLIDVYAKCGSTLAAGLIFDTMPERNVVSWNAMISGYAHQGQSEDALELFSQMQVEGWNPSNWTFASVLTACGSLAGMEQPTLVDGRWVKLECLHKGRSVHDEIDRLGYSTDLVVANCLIDMYAACGSMVDAELVFGRLANRDVVTWTAMISGHAMHSQAEQAVELYRRMLQNGVRPNEATFLSLLRACSTAGTLHLCQQIHGDIVAAGLELDARVATTLIHTYCRRGSMKDAQQVFDRLENRDVFSWTALIAGYARHGEAETSLQLLEDMRQSGIQPNGVTFLCVLTACSHSGMVQKGLQVFESMSADSSVSVGVEHYVCLVDLVGRAGLFAQVEALLSELPPQPSIALWLSVLRACQTHSNIPLGRRAFEAAVQLDPKRAAPYLLMANLYACLQMWEAACEIEDRSRRAGAWKEPGLSWVEHGELVHPFVAGDRSHPASPQVYSELYDLGQRLKAMNDLK